MYTLEGPDIAAFIFALLKSRKVRERQRKTRVGINSPNYWAGKPSTSRDKRQQREKSARVTSQSFAHSGEGVIWFPENIFLL